MDAKTNILKEVNAKLAVIESAIAANGLLIAANGALITTNTNAVIANAGAIAANAEAIAAVGFVDRGDIDSFDFVTGDFTSFYEWADLDLHAIVGAARRLVILHVVIEEASIGWHFSLRTKGNANDYNIQSVYNQVAGKDVSQVFAIYTDANGVIQYNTHCANFDVLNVAVCGWFK